MGEKRYLTGEYLKYYEEFSSSNVNSSATNFKSEVEILTQEFANIKNVIVNWSGEGALALSNQALTSIFNKFDAIQQNVDSALIPATEAMENLKIELELMKEKEELLIQKEEELAIENAKNIPEKVPNGKNKDGRTIYKINPEYSAWLKRKEDLALEIKNLITLLDETKLKCEEYIETIALLEGSMTEFSDYLGITKTVLGFDGGITSEYSSMSLEERVATLNSLLDNYKVVLAELDEMYNQAYGKGFSFSSKDFENVFMLFDAFDLFYKSGTDINEFKNLASDGSNVLMKIDALTKVMSYCRSTGAIQKITDYLNGESWEESGLAELYDQDGIFGYNENKFNLRMRTWYGLDNPKEYLKNNLSGILNSWENLDEAYTQYEAMRETVGVMQAKVDSFEKAIKLLPYEIHIEDELFIGKYKDKKYGNFSELSDIYNNNMTDTEKALYSYLKDTKGEAYAREYLDLMEDPMNMREGMARAKEYVEWLGKDGFQITDIALSGTEGFKDGVRTFFDGIADLFRVADTEAGTKSALDYELMYKAQYMLDMADSLDIDIDPNLRNFLNQAYQTGSTVGTMAVPMIAGAIPGAGQVLSTTLMTASFAGNAAVEGRQNGLGVGAAYLYGAISGGSEVILEKTLGRVPFVGNLSGSLVKDAASEMLEEGIQAYIDAGLGVVFYGEEFDFKATTAEAWESAKQAAISTPFMQGFGKVVGATVGTTSTIAVNTFTRGNYTTGQVYEMASQKISDFYVGKADAAISAGIDVANVNGKVSMLDKLFLDKAISNVSAEELSGITSKMPKEGLEKLVDSGILSKKSMEKLNLADTFTKIESQPAGQKLDVSSLTSKDLKAEVTRDGQTLSEYIGSNKRDSVTPETISELKDISRSQAHKVETIIKEEIKAEIKQARHDVVMTTAKKTVAGIKNFVTQSQATTTASTQQHATISQLGQSQGTQPVHSQQTVQSQTEIAPVVDAVQNGSVRQNFDVFAAQDTTLASQERHNNIPRMAKASSVGIISALGAIFPRLSAKFGGNTVIGKAQLDAKQVRLSEQQSTTAQTSITTTQSSIAAEQTSAPAKTETRQEYRDTITGEQAHEKSRQFHEETAQQRTKDNNAVATTENVEVTKSRDNQPVARAREDVINERLKKDIETGNVGRIREVLSTMTAKEIATTLETMPLKEAVYVRQQLSPEERINVIFEEGMLAARGKYKEFFENFREHGAEHTALVTEYSLKIARESGVYLNLSEIEYASRFHDLGMRGGIVLKGEENGRYTFGRVDEILTPAADKTIGRTRAELARKNHPLNSAISILMEKVTPEGIDSDVVSLLAMSHSKSTSGIKDFSTKEYWTECINQLEQAVDYVRREENISIEFNAEKLMRMINDPATFQRLQDEALCIRDGDAMSKLAYEGDPKEGKTIMQTGTHTKLIAKEGMQRTRITTEMSVEEKRAAFNEKIVPETIDAEVEGFTDVIYDKEGNVVGEVKEKYSKHVHAGELNSEFESQFNGRTREYVAIARPIDANTHPYSTFAAIEERIGEVATYGNCVEIREDGSRIDRREFLILLPEEARGTTIGNKYEELLSNFKKSQLSPKGLAKLSEAQKEFYVSSNVRIVYTSETSIEAIKGTPSNPQIDIVTETAEKQSSAISVDASVTQETSSQISSETSQTFDEKLSNTSQEEIVQDSIGKQPELHVEENNQSINGMVLETSSNTFETISEVSKPSSKSIELSEEEFINDLDKNNLDLTKYDDDTLYRFRIAIANAFLSIDYGDLTLLPDVIKHDIDVLNLVFENYNLYSFGKNDPIISKFLVDNFERVIEKIRNGEISSSYITDLPIEFQNSEKLIDACIDSGKLDGLASANNKEYIILQEDRILEQIEKGAMFLLKSLPEKLRASEKIIEAIMKKGTICCLTGVTNAEFVLQKKDLLIDSINKYGFRMFKVPQFMLDDYDIVNAIAGCTSIYFPNLRGNDLKLLEQVIIERINSGKYVNVDLIKYLKNSSQIANAYFKNGIFDCASLFDSSILTPENIDLIVTEIERETKYPNLEKFPGYIKNSSEIVKLLIERNAIEGIFGATPEAISQNRNTIISLIENGTFFGEKIDYIAAGIRNDREIISLLVKNGDLRILDYADPQIVLENKEGILNAIRNGHEFSILSTMPEEIRSSKEIVEAILLTGNLKNIKYALDAAFDGRNIQIFAETIKNTRQEIFLEEYLGELINYPLAVRNSPEIIYAMLEKISFKQRGEIRLCEDSTLYTFNGITNEFIENNVNELVNHIQNWDTVVQFMSKIDVSDEAKLILWKKIITRPYNSMNIYREIPAFVATKLETEIIDSLRKKCIGNQIYSLDYISPEIKKLPSFLELSLEKLPINNIFADPILSELISEQQVIEYIERNKMDISLRSFPEKYKSSPEFLEYLAKTGHIEFIFGCNQDALTDKTIALIADTIRKNSPLKSGSLYECFRYLNPNSRIAKSSVILQALIDGKNYNELIRNFTSEAYTTEIVEKILEEVLNGNFKDYSILISKIDESKFNNDVVEKIVDNFLGGNLEILSILPDNLIVKYQERIIKNFPYDEVMKRGKSYRLDDMKSFILASPDIVREFIDRGRYFEYDRYDFNRESLRANIDYFAEKILNGDINLDADAVLTANYEFLSSPKVVEALIKTGNLEMMRKVNPEAITENNINLFIEQLRKGKDISLLVFYPEVIRNNKLVIETLTQTGKVSVLTGLPTEFYFDYSESISKSLGITEASYKEKIEKLLSINDEIFSTLNLAMLSDSLSGLNLEFIERCSLYGDIQQAIINLSNNPKYLQTFIKISNILQKNIQNIDLNGIVYRILNNGLSSNSSFATLLNEINVDSLTSEQMSTLIKILQTKNNLYEIQNMEDLIPENYINKKQQYFDNMIDAVEKGTLSLEQMKSLVASKLFDLDYELVSFINDRYNFDINALERLDNTVEKEELAEVIEFLKAVNNVVTTTDIDVLRNIYLNANVILNNNLLDNFAIEETIRSKYAKLFSSTLYTPQENDLSQNNMLRTVRYKGKDIKVYQVEDAFRMQIHSLGAYREFKIPENFKTDWLRPKIAFHGICTSYIGNDSISPAFIGYPVLGFSEYEESALLLSGNYDLFSDSTIAKYETSMAKAYTFLPPSMMIDYTRHNHNEMVLERRKNTNTDGEISKRLPNYIVYFVEDMGESNFSEKNALWNETKQAAADFEVPIVVINRSHFLQSEMEQCKKLEEEFFETHSTEKLRTIMNKYINNSVGCRFLGNTLKKGTTAFSPKATQEFYERVLDEVERLIANNQKTEASNIVDELLEIIEKENIAVEVSHKSERLEKTFDYIKERNRLESLKNRLMN